LRKTAGKYEKNIGKIGEKQQENMRKTYEKNLGL
jgi:hypothetical protein